MLVCVKVATSHGDVEPHIKHFLNMILPVWRQDDSLQVGQTICLSLVKYPFNDFSFRAVFNIGSSQKNTNILFYTPTYLTTKLYKYVYKIIYTELRKIQFCKKNNHNLLKGIPVASGAHVMKYDYIKTFIISVQRGNH